MSARFSIFQWHWQLPTYDGTKSYQNLLVGVYGGVNDGSNRDSIIQQKPINLIHNGFYDYDSGGIGGRNNVGYYWRPSSVSADNARSLYFHSTYLSPLGYGNDKGLGFSLRCLVR